MHKLNTRRLISLSLLSALAFSLHFIEGNIPSLFPIPGFRIGLANIILIFVLYYYDIKSYIFVLLLKILLVSILTNGFSVSFFMSLAGSLLSCISAIIIKKYIKASIYGVSIFSSLMHTIGQLIIYSLFFNAPYIFNYILILGPLSLLSGYLIALLSKFLIKIIPEKFKFEEQKRR